MDIIEEIREKLNDEEIMDRLLLYASIRQVVEKASELFGDEDELTQFFIGEFKKIEEELDKELNEEI